MKLLRPGLFALPTLFLMCACVDSTNSGRASQPSGAIQAQRDAANKLAFNCVSVKARQYAKTSGSPFELGILAANACENHINESARAYADGNPRVEVMNRQNFKTSMAEAAAQMIVELRTN